MIIMSFPRWEKASTVLCNSSVAAEEEGGACPGSLNLTGLLNLLQWQRL